MAAKEDIRRSVARRMQTATEQIAAAEQAAIRQIKDRAVTVAVAAAGDVSARSMTKADDANRLIDAAISRGRREAALTDAPAPALDAAPDLDHDGWGRRFVSRRRCAAGRAAMVAIETRKAQLEARLAELRPGCTGSRTSSNSRSASASPSRRSNARTRRCWRTSAPPACRRSE